MQQEFGLATAGNNVRLRKLSNASRKWTLGLLMIFMNPIGVIPLNEIPCFIIPAESLINLIFQQISGSQ